MSKLEFDRVDWMTVGAVGSPGERTFLIQARRGLDLATFVIEKGQAISLAQSSFKLISMMGLTERQILDFEEAPELETDAPLWRVGNIQFGYSAEEEMVVVEFQEVIDPQAEQAGGEWSQATIRLSLLQLASLARRSLEVAAKGRPVCPFCWQVKETEGHVCIATNGHHARS